MSKEKIAIFPPIEEAEIGVREVTADEEEIEPVQIIQSIPFPIEREERKR